MQLILFLRSLIPFLPKIVLSLNEPISNDLMIEVRIISAMSIKPMIEGIGFDLKMHLIVKCIPGLL